MRIDLGGHPVQAGSKRAPGHSRVRRARRKSSWPEGEPSAKDGGKRQRFCGEPCRRHFAKAALAWVMDAVATGKLSREDLRNGPPATRRSFLEGGTGDGVGEVAYIAWASPRPAQALRASHTLTPARLRAGERPHALRPSRRASTSPTGFGAQQRSGCRNSLTVHLRR
jgi:hypothetical protein